MSAIATLASVTRPDSWDFPLFLHILGAMVLVGALTLSAVALIAAWRSGSAALTKLGFMSLFYGAIPGYLVMRAAAAWIANKEGLDNDKVDLTWVNIGFSVSDIGFLLLLIALVIGGINVRLINRGQGGKPTGPVRIATGLVSVFLLACLVAVWAMTTKPV